MNEQYEIPLEGRKIGNIPIDVLKGEGEDCFHCARFAKATRRTISSSMARGLILMAGLLGREHPGGWVYFPDLPKFLLRSKTLSQAKYWRLIEPRGNDDPTIKGSGWWRLTADGMRFVSGDATVTNWAWVYDDHVLDFDGPQVSIRESLGRRFDYSRLLSESNYRGH